MTTRVPASFYILPHKIETCLNKFTLVEDHIRINTEIYTHLTGGDYSVLTSSSKTDAFDMLIQTINKLDIASIHIHNIENKLTLIKRALLSIHHAQHVT